MDYSFSMFWLCCEHIKWNDVITVQTAPLIDFDNNFLVFIIDIINFHRIQSQTSYAHTTQIAIGLPTVAEPLTSDTVTGFLAPSN